MIDESGSAVAGFALAAPLIALMLSAAVALAGALWQREVAQALLSKSVSIAAAHHGSLTEAKTRFIAEVSEAGLAAKELSWQLLHVQGVDVIEGSSVLTLGGGVIPAFDVRLHALASIG